MVPVGRRVEDFVERVVAGGDEAGGGQANDDSDGEVTEVDAGDGAEGDDDAGNDEDVLEPVVRPRDLDVRPPIDPFSRHGAR